MEKYYAIIEEGYIVLVGTGSGGVEIAREEYETILAVVKDCPAAEAGYCHKLRTDLTWELCLIPDVEDDAETMEEDYIAALSELGVSVDEEA